MEKKIDILNVKITPEIINEIENMQNSNETLISSLILNNYLNASNKNAIKDILFIARYNNELVGFVFAKDLIDTFDLEYILVDSKFRKNGVGTKLLSSLSTYCLNKNVPKIMLEVRKGNKAAINLYEKNGFKMINIRKDYYSDTLEDAYIYENKIEK